MVKSNEINTLSYFSPEYELKFLKIFIGTLENKAGTVFRNCSFGNEMIFVVDESHFEYDLCKVCINLIKEYYNKYKKIPFYDSILELYRTKIGTNNSDFDVFMKDVKHCLIDDERLIKDTSKNFILSKNLYNATIEIQKDIKKKNFNDYNSCVTKVRKSLEVNDIENNDTLISTKTLFEVLEDNPETVPTKWDNVNKVMGGGAARKKTTLVFAGSNVGKTTFSVVLADDLSQMGQNVVYISGEDEKSDFGFKLLTKYTSIQKPDYKNNKDFAEKQFAKAYKDNGRLIIKKLNKKERNVEYLVKYLTDLYYLRGFKIDVIIVDYLDTLIQGIDAWKKQLDVIFELQGLSEELNFANIIIHQAKADTVGKARLTREDMKGDTKIFDSVRTVWGLTKTAEQQNTPKGNFEIIKNKDGYAMVLYEDILFDNKEVKFEVNTASVQQTVKKAVNKLLDNI